MSNSHETDALQRDLAQLRKDLSALSQRVQSRSDKRVRAGVNKARDRFGDWSDEVESRPYTGILIALGVGLLAGRLLGR